MASPPPLVAGPAPGTYAPWFTACAIDGNPRYAFSSCGGRAILLLFLGSAGIPAVRAALDQVEQRRDLFDDVSASFFGVTVDAADVTHRRVVPRIPGLRFFDDGDRAISTAYGAITEGHGYLPHFLVLDRQLRVVERFPLAAADSALECLAAMAAPFDNGWAPVIEVPRVLEPALCARLIAAYQAGGGTASGFMREVDGKTRLVLDPAFKRRRDHDIVDPLLRQALIARLRTRLVPAIERAFQFTATRIERYIVACYDAADAGHFQPHRDNTTKGTAHRRFAVTINLNDDFDGGELRFPEFGPRRYRAPTGGAIVFSCSLLHEATPVTRGTRYATLPFLYDEAGAALREENSRFVESGVTYRA